MAKNKVMAVGREIETAQVKRQANGELMEEVASLNTSVAIQTKWEYGRWYDYEGKL